MKCALLVGVVRLYQNKLTTQVLSARLANINLPLQMWGRLEKACGNSTFADLLLRPNKVLTWTAGMQQQAGQMAQVVRKLLRAGVPGHHIAILYPKYIIADGIVPALLHMRVPYIRHGRNKLLNRRALLVLAT